MLCKVQNIYIKPEKNQNGIFIECGYLIQGFGFEGDIKGGKKDRHISIMSQQTLLDLDKLGIKGICTEKFKPNIIVSNNIQMETGMLFKMGESQIRITSERKKCYLDCDIYKSKIKCPLYGIRFAEILASGTIEIGTEIIRCI